MVNEIPKLETKDIVDDKLKVTKTTASFKNFTKEYYVQNFGTRAGIVIHKNDELLLVSQYRLLINNYSWEIPGGSIEVDESPTEGAIRETVEETGYKCNNLKLLIHYEEDLDCVQNSVYIYSSDNYNKTFTVKYSCDEIVNSKWFKIKDCIKLIHDGYLLDCYSIIAVLLI